MLVVESILLVLAVKIVLQHIHLMCGHALVIEQCRRVPNYDVTLTLRRGCRLLRCWRLPSVGWQSELKDGAVRRVRRRPETPAMRLDDRSADGDPHTHTVRFRREQGLEDAIGCRRIYARARILDRNKHAARFDAFRRYRQYLRAIGRPTNRVSRGSHFVGATENMRQPRRDSSQRANTDSAARIAPRSYLRDPGACAGSAARRIYSHRRR